jgi:hypothetical protein
MSKIKEVMLLALVADGSIEMKIDQNEALWGSARDGNNA